MNCRGVKVHSVGVEIHSEGLSVGVKLHPAGSTRPKLRFDFHSCGWRMRTNAPDGGSLWTSANELA